MFENLFDRINKNISPILLAKIIIGHPVTSIEELFKVLDMALDSAENDGVSICPICGNNNKGVQNDASPVFEGHCCDNCYSALVEPLKQILETETPTPKVQKVEDAFATTDFSFN